MWHCPHCGAEQNSSNNTYCRSCGKKMGGGGGCYLTSACSEAKNLPDNCLELTTLRTYRDEFVLQTEAGKQDINHYYKVAPKIVEKINAEPNSLEIYDDLYEELVLESVELIQQEKFEEAYDLYKNKSLELEKKFIN